MALDSYYHENHVLPKDYSDGENPIMSWRVAVARALDFPGASRQLKTDERWDSPANRAHLAPMPPMFQSTEEDAGMTCVVLVKGSGPFSGFGTGGPKTIVAAYLKKENAVPWAAPMDVEYKDVADVAQYVLLSDGSVVSPDAMSGGMEVKSTGAPESGGAR